MKRKTITLAICFMLHIAGNQLFAQCCNYTHQQQVEPATSSATFGVALGDFDNDGDQDAVSISAYFGIDVYFNNGSGTFTLHAQYDTIGDTDYYGVRVCDVDNDGDKDIIAMPFYQSSSLTVLKNNGAGVFTVYHYSSSIYTYNGAVGDIDGDGDIDVFLPNSGGGSGKIFKNNGSGSFSLFQTLPGARGHDVELADLDGDGDLDAFVVENSSYGNTVFLNNGSGTFTQLGAAFGTNGSNVGLGDLDGDGDIDAWVGTANNPSEIYTNNGSAIFTLDTIINTGSYCKAVNFYDMDGDGDLDVFLGFYSSNPQVWKNDGNLSFSLCYNAPVGSSCHGQTIGFINNDGLIDIYSGGFSNTTGDYVFLNAGIVNANILYKDSPFCSYTTSPQSVIQSGPTGGTYSASPAGLTINSTNGEIIPSTSTPGTYTVTYTVSGCPATTSVVINTLDMTTTLAGSTISSNQNGAVYQWLDCNTGFAPIPLETNQSFAPTSSGSYAVWVTYVGCTDTSTCVPFIAVGTESFPAQNSILLFPNPANTLINLQVTTSLIGSEYCICNSLGQNVLTGNVKNEISTIDISGLPNGTYLLQIENQAKRIFNVIK